MGAGEPEFLAYLDGVVPQHFLGKFPLEVLSQLAVGLLRAQGHLVFGVHFHTDDGIIKAANDPAGAHLKLQGLAIDTAIENGAVFQAAGIVQLHKIALFYSGHRLSLGSSGFQRVCRLPQLLIHDCRGETVWAHLPVARGTGAGGLDKKSLPGFRSPDRPGWRWCGNGVRPFPRSGPGGPSSPRPLRTRLPGLLPGS